MQRTQTSIASGCSLGHCISDVLHAGPTFLFLGTEDEAPREEGASWGEGVDKNPIQNISIWNSGTERENSKNHPIKKSPVFTSLGRALGTEAQGVGSWVSSAKNRTKDTWICALTTLKWGSSTAAAVVMATKQQTDRRHNQGDCSVMLYPSCKNTKMYINLRKLWKQVQ